MSKENFTQGSRSLGYSNLKSEKTWQAVIKTNSSLVTYVSRIRGKLYISHASIFFSVRIATVN